MPALPENLLLAMGFSVITLVTAKGVTTAYVASGRVVKPIVPDGHATLADLVTQDGSTAPDLSKVQMLTWTAIAAVSYLLVVLASIPTYRGGAYFPDINAALMALMGLGQGAYLGAKVVQNQGATINNLAPPRGQQSGEAISINGSGFGITVGQVLFGDVVAEVQMDSSSNPKWSDATVAFIIPPCDRTGAPFTQGETVNVAILLPSVNGSTATAPVTYTF